jgi:hypothetical protein
MKITLWHNKDEKAVEYQNPKTGKSIDFETAHELLQFLIEKAGKMTFEVKVEQF